MKTIELKPSHDVMVHYNDDGNIHRISFQSYEDLQLNEEVRLALEGEEDSEIIGHISKISGNRYYFNP